MKQWLIDEQGTVTDERIVAAAELGFDTLAIKPTDRLEEIAEICLRLGLKIVPIIADWGNIKQDHPEMAFRNHKDKSSFDSQDPRVPPNNWPSFWHPDAVDLIRDQFRLSAQAAGAILGGFLIGIGHGDASVMPINWHRCENGNKLSNDNWTFDESALAEARRMYGKSAELKHHPEDDYDLRTLNFIQVGMMNRMGEIASAACELDKHIWCMILPFPGNSYLNMACGYAYGMHQRWAQWAQNFSRENEAEIGFAMLNVLRDAQAVQIAQAAAMIDPANMDCECLIGVHSAKNYLFKVQDDVQTARDLDATGVLCPIDRLDDLFGRNDRLVVEAIEEQKEPTKYLDAAKSMKEVKENATRESVAVVDGEVVGEEGDSL